MNILVPNILGMDCPHVIVECDVLEVRRRRFFGDIIITIRRITNPKNEDCGQIIFNLRNFKQTCNRLDAQLQIAQQVNLKKGPYTPYQFACNVM